MRRPMGECLKRASPAEAEAGPCFPPCFSSDPHGEELGAEDSAWVPLCDRLGLVPEPPVPPSHSASAPLASDAAEGASELGASSSGLASAPLAAVGFGGPGMLLPPALTGFGGESPSVLSSGFGGQWQLEQSLQQAPADFLQRMAEDAERRRLEAEAARAARALHRQARTKRDPESDDDKMGLEAGRLLFLESSTGTDSAEDALSYTETYWDSRRRRSCPSTKLFSSATAIEEVHSSFGPAE